jgi:hypothetical protein
VFVVGIDPGDTQSAYAVVDAHYEVVEADKVENEALALFLKCTLVDTHVVVEGIQSYGMPVGRNVFDTCYQIGRILQICDDLGLPWTIYNRPEYTKAICGVQKISDSVLRQALLLRFGGDKKGEPLNKLKGSTDKRSAFAIAAYHLDVTGGGKR